MSDIGLYQPGDSLMHRMPASIKLGVLVVVGIGLLFLRTPLAVGLALAATLVLYVIAGFGPAIMLRQVRPVMWFVVVIFGFQLLATGWEAAVVAVGIVLVLVLLAAVVTLTTRTSDLIDVVVAVCRPLRMLGIDPERIGLLIALGIRAVPIIAGFAQEILDAQRARSVRPSPKAFAAPLLVRTLRHADNVGDALVARGLDD